MYDTKVVLKDGRTIVGAIWEFAPEKGYMIIGECDDRLYFRDMFSCVTFGARISIDEFGDRDELKRAKDNGWRE